MSKTVAGVMGPGKGASADAISVAHELGQLIAKEGWVLLTGGRDVGVMDAASKGAKGANGLTVGILPGADTRGMSTAVDIPIVTGIGQARNNINVLSSDVVFVCGISAGTASEAALALKAGKNIILLCCNPEGEAFFKALSSERVFIAKGPSDAMTIAKQIVAA